MRLVPAETSLVIAGAWNPAILQPSWLLKHGLRNEGENVPVQVFLPMGANGPIEAPKFVIEDISYVVRPDVLMLSLKDGVGDLSHLEETSANALSVLEHTPVNGVGHNFEFKQTVLHDPELQVFTASRQDITDVAPENWEAAGQSISSSFSLLGGRIFVNIQRTFEANQISVRFNFHHPVASAREAVAILRGEEGYGRMDANMRTAVELMETVYGRGE